MYDHVCTNDMGEGLKGILFRLFLYFINLKVTNSGLIYGIDLKGVLLPNFSPTHDPLNMRPIDR